MAPCLTPFLRRLDINIVLASKSHMQIEILRFNTQKFSREWTDLRCRPYIFYAIINLRNYRQLIPFVQHRPTASCYKHVVCSYSCTNECVVMACQLARGQPSTPGLTECRLPAMTCHGCARCSALSIACHVIWVNGRPAEMSRRENRLSD